MSKNTTVDFKNPWLSEGMTALSEYFSAQHARGQTAAGSFGGLPSVSDVFDSH